MAWQLLTAVSVITFSISILLRRVLLYNDKSDPIAYVVIFQGIVGTLTGIYAIFHGIVLPDFSQYWFPILATIILYGLGHIVSAKSLQLIEASIFSILFASSAIWTMIVGLFLFSDRLNATQFIGAALVFMSIFALAENKKSLKLDRGIALGLLSSAIFGVAVAAWAYVGRRSDAPTWTALSFLGPSLFVLIFNPKVVLRMKPLLVRDVLIRMLLLGVIFSVSALASLLAYRDGNVNLVATLQQTGIIVTTVLGVIFLNERKNLRQKAVAAAICFAGVLLII